MNGCVIPHTPISVDCWRIRKNPNAKVFFLTHLHGDHIAGLTPTWSLPIYCTPVTKALLVHKLQISKDLIKALEVNTKHTVWLDEEESEMMTVTVLDAHHCPGAAMFLFQGYFGTILHTGDFRFSDQMFINTPLSVPLSVDVLYLDNTYSSAECEFPTRQHATEQIFDILDSHPDHDVLVGMYTLGKEDLLVAMALHMRTWVVVLQEQYEVLSILDMPNVFTTNVEMGHIHVVPMRRVSATLHRWSRQCPSIAIIPTALHYGSSGIQNTTGNVYVVPYSDHSCYSELKRFVKKVRPRKILPIVSANARGPRGEDISGRADMSCYKKYMDPQDVVPFKVPATVEAYMARHTTIGVRRFKKRKCSGTIYHYVKKAKLAKHRQGVQFEDMDDNAKEHTSKREKEGSDTKTAIILSKTTKLQQNAIKWHLIPIDIPQNQRESAWNSIKDPHSYFKNVCIKPDDVSSCPAVELDSRQEIKESAVKQNTMDAIKEAHLYTSSHHTGDNAMVFEGVPSTATCQDVIQSEPKRCNANYCTGLKPTKHSDSTPCMSVPFPIHSCIGIQDECVTGQRDSDNGGSGRLVYEQGSGKTITTPCTIASEQCNIGIVANGEIVGSTRNEENNKTCVETSTSLLVLAPEDRQSNLTVNSLKQDVSLEYEDLTDKPNATSQSQFQLQKIKLDPVLLESNNAEDQMSMEEKNPDNGIVISSVASVCDQLASDICFVTQKARELSLKVEQSVLNKTVVTDPQMALSKMLEIDHSDDSSLAKQCRINSSHVAICVSAAQPPGLEYGDVLLNRSKNGGNPSITSGMPRDLSHISQDTPSTSHQSADTSHSDGLCSVDIDTQPNAVQKRLYTIDVNTLNSLLLSDPTSNENLVDPNDNMEARIVQAHPVTFTAGNTIRTGGTALPTSQIIDPAIVAPEAVSQELKQLTSDLLDRINEHLHNTCGFSENQEDACSPSDDMCQTETIAISEKLELEMNRNNAEYASSNSGAGTSIRHGSATLQNKASHSEKYFVWGPTSGISSWHLRGKKRIYDPRRDLCEDSVDLPGGLTVAGTALCQADQCNQDNREKDMAHKKKKGFPKGKPQGSRNKLRTPDNNLAKSNEKQIKLVIKLGKLPKSLFQRNDHSNRSYCSEKTEISSNCGECETGLSPSSVNQSIPEMLANNCPSWGADYRELTSLDAHVNNLHEHVLVPPQLSVPSPNNNTIDVINNGEFIPLDNIEESSYIVQANDITNVPLCQMSSACDEDLCSCKTDLVSQRIDEEKEQFGKPQNGRQSLLHDFSDEYIGHENITASGNTDSQRAEQDYKSSEQIYNKQQYSPSENSVQDCCNMICSAPFAVNAPSIMASPKQVATLQDIISESSKLSVTATVSGTPSISALKKANISIPTWASSPCLSQLGTVCSKLSPTLHTSTIPLSLVGSTNSTTLPVSNITDPLLDEVAVASTPPSQANSPQQLSVCSSVPPVLHIVTAAPSPVADTNLTPLPVSNITDSPLDEVYVASTPPSQANSPQQLSVCSSMPPALHTVTSAPSPVDDTNLTPLPVSNITDPPLGEVSVASTSPSEANSPQQLSVCSSVPPAFHTVASAPSPVDDTNSTPLPVNNITDLLLDEVSVASTPPSQANSPQQLSVCSSALPALHIVTAVPPPVADTNLTPLPVSNITDSPLGNISVHSTQPSQENTPSSSPMGVGCSSLPAALYTITGALSPVGSTNYTLLPVSETSVPSTTPPSQATSLFPAPLDSTNCTLTSVSNITTPPLHKASSVPSVPSLQRSAPSITLPPISAHSSSVQATISFMPSPQSSVTSTAQSHIYDKQPHKSRSPCSQASYMIHVSSDGNCAKSWVSRHKERGSLLSTSQPMRTSSGKESRSDMANPSIYINNEIDLVSNDVSNGDGDEANNNRCEADLRNSNDQPCKSDVDNLLAYGNEWSLLKKNQSETGDVDGDNCELASNLVVGSNVRETFLTGMDTTLQKRTSESIVQCEGPLQSMPDRLCVCVVTSSEQPMPILWTQRKKRRLRTLSVSKVVCTSVGKRKCEEDCNDVCITGEGFESLLLMTNRHWSMTSHSYSHSRYNDFTEKTQCKTLPLIPKKNSSQKVMARKVPLHIEIQGAKYAKKQERKHVNKQGSILRYVVPNKGKPGTCFPDSVWRTKDSDIKMTLPISGQQHSTRKGSSSKSNPRVVRPSTEDLGQSVLPKQTLVSTGKGKFGSVKSAQRLGASSKDETRAKMCTNGDAELSTHLRSSSGELVKRVERLRVNSMNRTTRRATLSGHRLLRDWKPNEGLRKKQSEEAGVTTLCTGKGNLNLVNSAKPKANLFKTCEDKVAVAKRRDTPKGKTGMGILSKLTVNEVGSSGIRRFVMPDIRKSQVSFGGKEKTSSVLCLQTGRN